MEPSLPSHSSKSLPFPFPPSLRTRVFPTPSDTEPLLSFSSLPNPNPIRRSFSDVCASAPMDYRYRAAEDRDPLLFSSSSSSAPTTTNSYFTEQALRAGYIDVEGDIRRGDFMQPITCREALQRELQKERIREEHIARGIARRRILEEEVRRELELQRAMATRRLQLERYSSVAEAPVHTEAGLERRMQFGPEARIVDRFGPPQVLRYPEDRVPEWSPPPLLSPEPVVGGKLPLPLQQPEVSPFGKITSSKPKFSGMKRKSSAVTGGSGLPRPSKKEWSCALCQVSATSQQGLDEHLQGKKHKANLEALVEGKKLKATEAPLGANKSIKTKKAAGSTSGTKVTGKSLPTDGASTNGPVKSQREDRKQRTVQKKSYCCDLCKVKCNSEVMLACHLRGKKHIVQLEESKKGMANL